MSEEWISWLEELTQEDGERVGKKCANLGELTRAGFNIPPGFALSLRAYNDFLEVTGAGEEIRCYFASFDADPDDPKQLAKFGEASSVVQEIVQSRKMPAAIGDPLEGHYRELSRRTGVADVPVATRSAGPASHPGQYESFLEVRGREGVEENVIKVWASTFNTRSLIARARKGLPLESDPIGVAVLQMVDADAAGVMFTAEPTTADATRMILEGSRGLGEIVVAGAVIPDNWTVDSAQFAIVESMVAPTSESACLEEEEVLELARVGKCIEAHFGKPQDIEWAVDRDSASPIFILQARPETFRINFRF
jgi:phosphoenolpyruvate synthase/pyruvate phosphate dikinase